LPGWKRRSRAASTSTTASEFRFAQYVEDWRLKVERIGNVNYPEAARGKMYGSLVLAVGIKSDGMIDTVEVVKPSGFQVLDRAAERIVRMAAPYAAFPSDVRKDTDILVITRTWHFAQGDRMFGE
jgi:protein TonB